MGEECSTVGFVVERLACALVHRVVRQQFLLVSGERMVGGVSHLGRREGLGPYTCFQDIACVTHTEDERRGYIVLERSRCGGVIRQFLRAGIEPYGFALVVIRYHHACECRHGLFKRQ